MNATKAARRTLPETFAALKSAGKIGLVPFIPAGYPDLATTAALLVALERAGASVIEIGFPFTDPVADGPIIQEAFVDALAHKVKVTDIFAMLAAARPSLAVPVVAMVSFSIVFRFGVERFAREARAAGFDGLILPDLPPPEAQRYCQIIRQAGLDTILLVAPTTAPARRAEIVKLASGFVYYLSVSGITGERDQLPPNIAANVTQLHEITQLPICVGFGVSKARHVAQLATVADGAIVGSGIVRQIKAHIGQGPAAIAGAVEAYARELLSDAARRPAMLHST